MLMESAKEVFLKKLPMYVGVDENYRVRFRILRTAEMAVYGSIFHTHFEFDGLYRTMSCSGGNYDMEERTIHMFFENDEVRVHLKNCYNLEYPNPLPFYIVNNVWQDWFGGIGIHVLKV